jgi:hypothetical protein
LEAVLHALPNTGAHASFDTWYALGFVLKAYHGNKRGRVLWDRWSSQSDIYNAETQAAQWRWFDTDIVSPRVLKNIVALLLGDKEQIPPALSERSTQHRLTFRPRF